MVNVLELFAGSRSFGKEAEKKGFNVFSVDWTKYENIDLCMDIGHLKTSDIPFVPDVIWSSPDCSTYSIASCSTHRNKDRSPKTDYAAKCDTVNQHWLGLIKEFQLINPNLVYFIENPRGILRHMPWIKEYTRKTIWYCQYGGLKAKPTDIWTNSKKWKPRDICKNYRYNNDGEIINKHCHHESSRRGANTGTQGKKGSYIRSIVPEKLCVDIIKSIKKGNN